MTALATQEQVRQRSNGGGTGLAPISLTMDEIWNLAQNVAEAKMFPGFDTPQKVFSLMMLCNADGKHPMQCVRMYEFIQNRLSMKSPVIQAEFIRLGGRVEMVRSDREAAVAIFSHDTLQPKPIELKYTIEDAKLAGLAGKDNYKTNPQDMLWWRLMSKSINKIAPGIRNGIPSTEEARDEDYLGSQPSASVQVKLAEAELALAQPAMVGTELPIQGYTGTGPDSRNYARVAEDAVKAENDEITRTWEPLVAAGGVLPPLIDLKGLHGHMVHAAINLGYTEKPATSKAQHVVAALDKVYREHRDWVRNEILEYLLKEDNRIDAVAESEQERLAAVQTKDAEEDGEIVSASNENQASGPGEA